MTKRAAASNQVRHRRWSAIERGTEVAALFYSVLETVKLAGVEPREYLRTAVIASLRGDTIPLPHEFAASATAA